MSSEYRAKTLNLLFQFLSLGYKLTLGRIGRNNLTTFFNMKKVYQDWFTKHSSKSIQKTMSICPFPWNDFTKMASSVHHFNHRPLKYQGTFKHQVVAAIFLVPFFCSNKDKDCCKLPGASTGPQTSAECSSASICCHKQAAAQKTKFVSWPNFQRNKRSV